MNVTDFQETWQIDAGGQIYEGKFEEITQWIFEGSLLPQDLVRRGNLRWIEARKVPALIQFFNAKENGLPPPVIPGVVADSSAQFESPVLQTQNFAPAADLSAGRFEQNQQTGDSGDSGSAEKPFEPVQTSSFQNQGSAGFSQTDDWQAKLGAAGTAESFPPLPETQACVMHPDAEVAFVCETCANAFCKTCPKSYGDSVKICPFCGAMCRAFGEVVEKQKQAIYYRNAITEGFGLGDFFKALGYPFKFKSSLFFGAIMFMFFALGQSASAVGGIFMLSAALFCYMLANMLTFGVLANTVENFAQGKIGLNFMPSFDDFSLWDDVLHPFFLSVAVYLVCFGLLIAIIFGSVVWGLNSLSKSISSSYENPERVKIFTDEESPFEKNQALDKQKNLYGGDEFTNEEAINKSQSNPAYDEEEEFRKLNEMINQERRKQLESGIGKLPETELQERQQMYKQLLGAAGPIVIVCLISFLWGIFYFPAACCVAGYTRSFVATLNPAVGLETIKLLGWDYVKIWFMGLVLVIISFLVGMFLSLLLLPFDLPAMGNLPATAIGALFSFYVYVVFSVILGLALYKNADKMNLFKG